MTSAPAGSLTPLGRLLVTVAAGVIVLGGVRAASTVVGPVIIALLLTVAWSPASAALRRRGWNSTVAALMGIVLGVGIIALFVLLVWASLSQLQDKLPGYQPRVEELRLSVERLLQRLPFDTSLVLRAEALQPGALVGYAVVMIRGMTSTAGSLGVLVLIMAFMMIEATRYPAKLRLAASGSRAMARLDSFGEGLRDYVVINTVFGLVAAVLNTVLLLALGVDFAVLWGVASFALSFLPNIGFLVALVPPSALALVQFGPGKAVAVVAGFVVINFAVDNVIKPRFVGESLDLSPVVVLLSLIFWGWMLGISGALLAVPLTMAARFLFDGYDETRWLAVLMSDADPEGDARQKARDEAAAKAKRAAKADTD